MRLEKWILSLVILFLIFKSSFFYAQESFFIENKGQVVDQDGKANLEVLYTLTTGSYNVNFYKNHFTYEVFKIKERGVEINRVEVWPESISKSLEVEPHGALKEYSNFFQANTKVEKVSGYKELVYKNIWEGIDIVFFIANNQLKYNYVVSFQAKGAIKLNIKGAFPSIIGKQIFYTKESHVLLQENFPACYWEGEEDTSLLNNLLIEPLQSSIQISYPVNRKKTLIIDPIAYSEKETSYYGGIHQDFAEDIVLNSKKELIVIGYTLSLNNIATTGAYQQFIDNVDSYIAKFDSLGNRIWATYFGGNDFERSYSVAVDSYDNIILSGNTMSITGIATTGAYQSTLQSTDDSFIAKFTEGGSLIWSTYFGGGNHDFISSVTTDIQGNVYFTGHTSSSNYPITNDAHLSIFSNAETAYFTKLSSNGQLVHSSYIANGEGKGNEIAVGGNGIYIAGATKATNGISFSNSYQNTLEGDWDGFLIKMDKNTCQPVLGTYFGGASEDKFNGMKLVNDKIYLVGYTNSVTNIADVNSFQPLKSNYEDGMLVSFDTLGNKLWSTYVGSNGTDYLSSIDELNGELWLVGSSTSTNFATDSSAYQQFNKSGYDVTISNFTTTGNQTWVSYKGGTSDDYANSVVIDNFSNLYFCGNTGSNSGFSTTNAHQVYYGGNAFDGYWSKICKPVYPTYLSENTDTISICFGDSIEVNSLNNFSKYQWNSGDTTSGIVVKEAGDYYLQTVDQFGCPGKSDAISVVVFSDTIEINCSSLFICNNDSVLLSVDSTYTSYLWNNMSHSNMQYVQNTGQYWSVVEDGNGCIFYSDTLSLQQSSQDYLINVLGTPIICSGGEVVLYINSSGLANYSWSNLEQTPSVNINIPRDYWLTGINIEGCPISSDTIEVIVSNFQNQNISLSVVDTMSICKGDSLQINVNEAFVSYEWQDGSINDSFMSLEEGLVYVSVVDTNNCTARSDTLVIEYFLDKEVNVLYSQQLQICEGDSIEVNSNDSLYQVLWNNTIQSDSIWVSSDDSIFYKALDVNGCQLFSDTISLVVFESLYPLIQVIRNATYCNNDSTILLAESNSSIWNNQWVGDSLIVLSNGEYYYTLVDSITGCQWNSDSLTVEFITPKKSEIIANKTSFCFGQELILEQETPLDFNSFFWDNMVTSSVYSFNLNVSRYVYLTMLDVNDCFISDSIFIEGRDCLENILVYPNPTKEYLSIKSPHLVDGYIILNNIGEVVKKETEINLTDCIIDVNKLACGLYILILENKNINRAFKFEVID